MSKNLSLEEFKILERRIYDEYPDITKDEFNRKIVEFMIMTIEPAPKEIQQVVDDELNDIQNEDEDDYPD